MIILQFLRLKFSIFFKNFKLKIKKNYIYIILYSDIHLKIL